MFYPLNLRWISLDCVTHILLLLKPFADFLGETILPRINLLIYSVVWRYVSIFPRKLIFKKIRPYSIRMLFSSPLRRLNLTFFQGVTYSRFELISYFFFKHRKF